MKNKTVILGLFVDRIDILVCSRDQIVATKPIAHSFGTDAASWADALDTIGGLLEGAVKELGLSGAKTTVLYRNSTACADYSSLNIQSTSQAREAAILGCAESLSCPIDDATTAACVFGRDSAGRQGQTHLVVAADQDQVVDQIAQVIEEAGLKFEAAIPTDAPLMARLGERALREQAANRGYLYIGEHLSYFVIADKGSICFSRTINLGIDALIWSLTRSVRTSTGAAIELDFQDAREILLSFGFPRRDQVVCERRNLTGAQVMPLLQPVLQRFIIELRQSLRFGVQEDQRQSVELLMTGPGTVIPNFAALLATELGHTTTTDDRYAKYDWKSPCAEGCELRDAVADRKLLSQLELRPQRIARSKQLGRIRRWMWTGAAVAIAVIAMDGAHYYTHLGTLRQKVASVENQATDQKTLQATAEKLFGVISAMDTLEATIAKEAGDSISIRACMQELSRITPESIRLTAVMFNRDKGKSTGKLTGCAFDTGSGPGRTRLETFVEQLKSSPLFADVVLANVQTTTLGEQNGQQFEINMTGVGVPHTVSDSAVAAANGGKNP